MGNPSPSSRRSADIAAEMRALDLDGSLPVAWLMIGVVAAINTASVVFMLSSL